MRRANTVATLSPATSSYEESRFAPDARVSTAAVGAASRLASIGIDVGGTKILGGVIDAEGIVREQLFAPTPRQGDGIIDVVVDMVTSLRGRHDVAAMGVAVAGFVDRARSRVRHAPNLDWNDAPVRDRLESRVRMPIVVENDANAAAWGEYRFGAGVGSAEMVMVTLGTGVGGAIVSDGALFRGARGSAGELGHMRFVPDGRPCGCGQNGCLEQYASGRALQREAMEIAAVPGIGNALASRWGTNGCLSGAAISELVAARDPGALEAVRRIAVAVGTACGSFHAMLDPNVFVIGGGVADLGSTLLDPLHAAYSLSVPGSAGSALASFATARLGNDAGMIGAADLVRNHRAGAA